ncbi:MAG: glycosyltransferase family protein [Candidatus Peribacteraceae bacterium]|nr:glycosyltransferase family protein [Candidatus Peribacteraceae bacterium]
MKNVAIIQGRMTSSRLPGKILADIEGTPELLHVVRRARASEAFGEVVVATSTDPTDDPVEAFCTEKKIPCFRGSLDDVLDRYAKAAAAYEADIITRLTADCPLLDPAVIKRVVEEFKTGKYDYVTNSLERTFPKGLDAEVFSRAVLEKAAAEARKPDEREHVTPYMHDPKLFRIGHVTQTQNRGSLRWTVDYPEDLAFVRAVFKELGNRIFGQDEILALLERHPEIGKINAHIS